MYKSAHTPGRAFAPEVSSGSTPIEAEPDMNDKTPPTTHSSLPDRYARQTLFAGIGRAGQERLRTSRVAIIGCGALGTVLANNLARAGVGHLTIADRDFIEANNLQRQVLFDEDDLARNLPKAIAAAARLRRINSEIEITALAEDINAENIEAIVADVDLGMPGTDRKRTGLN